MKKGLLYILLLIPIYIVWGCHDHEEVWNEIPQPIVNFIETYWPGTYAQDYYSDSDGRHVVRIAYGPGLVFSADYGWISVDGYGEPMPEQFLFDCMPQDLYRYLKETQLTDQVFEASRDARTYELTLLNEDIIYTIADGSVHTVPTTPEGS